MIRVAFLSGVALLAGVARAATPTAEYELTFDATWSAATHPVDFPPNPHFSGLIGGTHDASISFWELGGIASTGIEKMAELGSKSPLDAEIGAAIPAGLADQLISGSGISPSPGATSVQFTASQDFPRLTLVSMIAPSPDWFVGVSGLALFDGVHWVESQTVQLFPHDAGTDSGTSYASADSDTDPQDPIALITTLPAGNGVPLGTFTLTRLDAPDPVPALPLPALALLAIALLAIATIARSRLQPRRHREDPGGAA